MSYVDQNLMPNEQVIYRAQIHWAMFLAPTLVMLIGLVFFGFLIVSRIVSGVFLLVAIFPFLIGLINFIGAIVTYLTTEFALTDKRVIAKTGALQRRSIELLLPKVESIAVTQPVFGRLLDYGTIVVTGTGGTKEIFRGVASPLELRNKVNAQLTFLLESANK